MPRQLSIVIGLVSAVLYHPLYTQDELIEQWALGVPAVSSRESIGDADTGHIAGEPDGTCDLLEDESYAGFAWRPGTPDAGAEWIEVRFERPVNASAIEVYETLNPGAITRVSVRALDGQLHEV